MMDEAFGTMTRLLNVSLVIHRNQETKYAYLATDTFSLLKFNDIARVY